MGFSEMCIVIPPCNHLSRSTIERIEDFLESPDLVVKQISLSLLQHSAYSKAVIEQGVSYAFAILSDIKDRWNSCEGYKATISRYINPYEDVAILILKDTPIGIFIV